MHYHTNMKVLFEMLFEILTIMLFEIQGIGHGIDAVHYYFEKYSFFKTAVINVLQIYFKQQVVAFLSLVSASLTAKYFLFHRRDCHDAATE